MEREYGPTPEETEHLASIVGALSDPQRIKMMMLMSSESGCCPSVGLSGNQRPSGVCVCEIQEALNLAQSRVSYHLKVLRDAGLIRETPQGKWTFYSVDAAALRSVLSLLEATILGTNST